MHRCSNCLKAPQQGLQWQNGGNSLQADTIRPLLQSTAAVSQHREKAAANGTETQECAGNEWNWKWTKPQTMHESFKIGKLQFRKNKTLWGQSVNSGCEDGNLRREFASRQLTFGLLRLWLQEWWSVLNWCVGAEIATSAFLWSYFVVSVCVNGHSSREIASPPTYNMSSSVSSS